MGHSLDIGRAFGAGVVISLAVPGCVTIRPQPLERPTRPAESPSPTAVVEAHDRVRAERGLVPLVVNPSLERAAMRHARDMAGRRKMSHRGGDGSSPFRRMEEEGYSFSRAAENVAAGVFSLESLMDAWMSSPPHRRNILGDFREVGAGVATSEDGTTYWCVTFGAPPRG